MPYTEKQVRVFRAIEHGWSPKKGSLKKLSPHKAGEMADEGVKFTGGHAAEALARRKRGK